MVVEKLKEIEKIALELGYEVALDLISENKSANMLRIDLGEECELDQDLTVMIYYDADDLDGSVFIQFFSQYEDEVSNVTEAYKRCAQMTRNTSLGHFNLSEDETRVYYRYMLAIDQKLVLRAEFINDILDMAVYAIEEFSQSHSGL